MNDKILILIEVLFFVGASYGAYTLMTWLF